MASNSNMMKADEDADDDLFTLKPKSLKKTKEPNPFSFKEFLNSADVETLPSELPAIVTETLPDISPGIPKKNANSADIKLDTANPYSFKQFINTPELPIESLPSVSSQNTSQIPPLPPSPPRLKPSKPTSRPQVHNSSLEHILPDCEDEKSDDDFDSPKTTNQRVKLNQKLTSQSIDDEIVLPSVELPTLDDLPNLDESTVSVETLHLENQSLRKQIESSQKQLLDQATLIKKLEKQIKTLKDREETENKTLEMMVQQVEQNLVKTTERAVKSEKHAETLKSEIKQLKAHVLTLTSENTQLKLLKSTAISESQQKRLEEYGEQLGHASNTAEASLKQLLGGLTSLRLISSSLKSFGKITEASSQE